MLRQSPHRRLLVAFTCCATCLTVGALPAAAQPVLDTSSGIHFEVGSWLTRFWQSVGEPVVSLFAADGTQTTPPPNPPTPPTSEVGVTIDPDGVPGP